MSIWIKETIRVLESHGHSAFVVCPDPSGDHGTYDDNVYAIGPVKSLKSYPSYRVVAQPLETIRKIKQIVRNERPDVIHSNTPLTIGFGALDASKDFRIPLVGTLHTLLPELIKYYPPLRPKMLGKLLGWQIYSNYYNLCDCVICPTDTIHMLLVRNGIRRRTYIVPNGVNIDRFKPSPNTDTNRGMIQCIPPDDKVILFMGRLSFEKKVDLLLMSFKRILRSLSNVTLLIVGDGPVKSSLSALAERLNISDKVFFLGEIVHENCLIPAVYKVADIFVLPSAFETQSLSILEAMASGKTVVATRTGGIVDLIKDNHNGLLVSYNDVDELTLTLLDLLVNEEKCQQIGKVARKTAEAYSSSLTTSKLVNVYESIVSSKKIAAKRSHDIPYHLLYSGTFFATYFLFDIFQMLNMT